MEQQTFFYLQQQRGPVERRRGDLRGWEEEGVTLHVFECVICVTKVALSLLSLALSLSLSCPPCNAFRSPANSLEKFINIHAPLDELPTRL
jgi:hypothetical protein